MCSPFNNTTEPELMDYAELVPLALGGAPRPTLSPGLVPESELMRLVTSRILDDSRGEVARRPKQAQLSDHPEIAVVGEHEQRGPDCERDTQTSLGRPTAPD